MNEDMKAGNEEESGKVMSIMEHLHELRGVLVKSLLSILILFVLAMVFANQIIEVLKLPLLSALPDGAKNLHFTGPMDVFIASLKVSFLTAVVFGCPVWSYQFWRFLEPGLYPTEKRLVLPFAIASMLLFFSGVAFCYFLILPMALNFLIGIGLEVGTPIITINDYISMLTILIFGFGLVFETPVVLVLLAMLDLVSAKSLSEFRPLVVVGILILSAILTPPDPISQLAMAVPVYLMYEASIIIIRVIKRPGKGEGSKPAHA